MHRIEWYHLIRHISSGSFSTSKNVSNTANFKILIHKYLLLQLEFSSRVYLDIFNVNLLVQFKLDVYMHDLSQFHDGVVFNGELEDERWKWHIEIEELCLLVVLFSCRLIEMIGGDVNGRGEHVCMCDIWHSICSTIWCAIYNVMNWPIQYLGDL